VRRRGAAGETEAGGAQNGEERWGKSSAWRGEGIPMGCMDDTWATMAGPSWVIGRDNHNWHVGQDVCAVGAPGTDAHGHAWI
jgi:hypothetical protein